LSKRFHPNIKTQNSISKISSAEISRGGFAVIHPSLRTNLSSSFLRVSRLQCACMLPFALVYRRWNRTDGSRLVFTVPSLDVPAIYFFFFSPLFHSPLILSPSVTYFIFHLQSATANRSPMRAGAHELRLLRISFPPISSWPHFIFRTTRL
jgi:hypothetical protein